jgi:iron complex outermembrane receptor protein
MALDYRTLIVFSIASASLIFAQNINVRIAGRITDTSGAAVAHVSVKLYSRTSPGSYAATSDDQGNYALSVPEGEYLLDATAPGLSLTKSPRQVFIKRPTDLPLEMGVAEASTAVQVTATGTAQSFDETAKAVDVVDRDELDRRGIQSAAEGLRAMPGLRVEQRGGPGTNTTIQTRGLRTFDTAVLIDGMRFRDVGATQGDASSFITDLLVVDTSKIEVLRGAGSSLYGTNAIGGIVNMVTDSGGGALHGNLTTDGGGLGEFRVLARLGGGGLGDRLHYSGGAGHQEVTDGVGGYGRYRNTTGNGLADYTFRPGLVLSARFLGTNAYGELYETASAAPAATLPPTGYIPAVALSTSQILLAEKSLPYTLGGATFIPALGDPDYSRTAQFVSSLIALQDQVSARLSLRLSYQALLSNRDVVNGPLGAGFQPAFRTSSEFNGRIDTVRGQANYAWGAHQILSGGYEFEREYFDSPASDNNPNPAKQVNSRAQVAERSHSFDAQDQVRLLHDRLQISLSGRIQDFTLDKPLFLGTVPVYAGVSAVSPPTAYTADASIAYFIHSTGTKIRSHGGNGYRKPSLYELFGTSFSGSTFTAYGDPRLKPERSIAIDGGVDQYFASDRLRLSATYFYTRLQQVIAFDSSGLITPATDPFGRSSGYRNTGGGIARGVELSGEARPRRGTQLRASYTYTNARDKYSEFADGTLQIPRITPNSFSLVALQQFGKHVDASFEFLAASDFLYQLSRRTFLFPGPRQGVLTAGYTRPLTEKISMRLNVRVNNILDQLYYEDGFRTPRRWATGGVAFSF